MSENLVDTQTVPVENFFADDHPPVLMQARIVEETLGAKLGTIARGTVLGRIKTDSTTVRVGKLRKYDADNTDGSENAMAILADPIIASAAPSLACNIYVHGVFNKTALTGADAAAEKFLQAVGVYLKEVN